LLPEKLAAWWLFGYDKAQLIFSIVSLVFSPVRRARKALAFPPLHQKEHVIFFLLLFFVIGACCLAGPGEDVAMASVEFNSTPAGAASFPIAVPSSGSRPGAPTANGKPCAAPTSVPAAEQHAADCQTGASRPLHRIREVRLQQGLTLRTAARHMGASVRQLRMEEEETTDLRLSDLYRWQQTLGVPTEDLLCEPEGALSRPVMDRARLVRLMKTAAAILENAPTPRLERLAQTLVEQLVEIMPELEQVNPWHAVGQRRSLDELGRVAEQQIADDFFHG
jgi:transcriptional regulator with XRE-family HTH domain